jgi:hypothetical protein
VTGRHRNPRPSFGIIAGSVALVLVAVLAGWGGYKLLSHPSSGCGARVSVNVAAAPEIAPVIQAMADQWTTQSGGSCYAVTVTSADPADVAAAVAGQRGATLTGLGQASGNARIPDVWVADSSTWLQRVRSAAADTVPADATSIAQSPVVLAMPQPVAASLGWPATKPGWGTLLQKMTSGSGLKTGIVEPGRDSSGLSGLLALRSAAATTGAQAQEVTVAALRALATGRSTVRQDLLGRFPRAADQAALANGLAAAPLPEQAVITYNATQPPVPLAAVFIDPGPAPLDYPYAVLPNLRTEVGVGARQFQQVLAGTAYKNALAQHGLRGPDGTVGAGFTALPGAPTGPISASPAADPDVMQQILSVWTAVIRPGRPLMLIDVSGSMLEPVPSMPGLNREQVTTKAAAGGLALFDDAWSVGLWVFSTNMDGTKPWKELVPIGPLVSQRTQLNAALGSIQANPKGNTGLYDTVLAAYKAEQAGWDPGKVNSVVLMTDGQNDNPGGLTLDQLTTELKKIADPKRPVEVIAIGIGTDVSKPELTTMTQVTGGGVFIVSDPAKIGEVFLQALALRPGLGG